MMCYTAGVYDFRRSCMKNKLLIILTVMLLVVCMPISANAELKPVADPWDDPNNLITDGAVYKTYNADGYVVAWETPECDVNGKYMLIENGTQLKVSYRVSYMGDVPWGSVSVPTEGEDGEEIFTGWVLMSDMLDSEGNPAAVAPVSIPEHPMIADPKPEPTPTASDDPEATPESTVPARPEQAINISNTYNNAIVYTSVAIAAVALAFAILVLVKHKALNKKGE